MSLRIWILIQAFREIWRRALQPSEWSELCPRVLFDQFVSPFFKGHIPPELHMAATENDDQFMLSTEGVIKKVKASLREYSLEPYRFTGILNGFAAAALAHYEKCEHCQNQSILQFAKNLKDRWIRKEIRKLTI